MLFNSIQFALFFPIVCIAYFFVTHKIKSNTASQILLLAASLFFYACWKAEYLALILISVIITWSSGILMEKVSARSETILKFSMNTPPPYISDKQIQFRKKLILATSLFLNLAILFFFKYFNFTFSTIGKIAGVLGREFASPKFNVLLPVGISFYTFQALGYSIDVFRGTVKAEHNFVTYALFVTFFPQLVAGPIERTERLLPQFKVNHTFNYERVTDGLKLTAYGLFLKIVIADRLAIFVDKVYGNVSSSSGSLLLLATFAFAVQVYADFNGYSTIAIGCAQVLGFNLVRNFQRPYFAKSIPEYWRRWHISLSSWFRDYLYFPVIGSKWCKKLCKGLAKFNRGGLKKARLLSGEVALWLVWLATGLWHGAAWHFVAWGMCHGVYQIIDLRTASLRRKIRIKCGLQEGSRIKRWWQYVQIVCTFCLVCISYVFFRAFRFLHTFTIFRKFLEIPKESYTTMLQIFNTGIQIQVGKEQMSNLITVFFIIVLFITDLCTRKENGTDVVRKLPFAIRWILYWFLVLAILFFQNFGQTEFLYFQF